MIHIVDFLDQSPIFFSLPILNVSSTFWGISPILPSVHPLNFIFNMVNNFQEYFIFCSFLNSLLLLHGCSIFFLTLSLRKVFDAHIPLFPPCFFFKLTCSGVPSNI